MAKITLNDLANLQNEASAVSTLNANNTLVEVAFENTLSRDGTAPNSMEADLDMDSNRILNLPAPGSANEPLRLTDLDGVVVPLFTDGDLGDITVSGGATVVTIDNNVVSYAKMQAVSAASKLLGRGSTLGSGNVEEITLGAGLVMTGSSLSSTGAPAGGDTTVQFNDGGSVFGGDSGLRYNKTMDVLTIEGGIRVSAGIVAPTTNDAAALGDTTRMWSDLFLASGAVINFANGNVTITHSTNALSFDGATAYFFSARIAPPSDDGAALGAGGGAWSDLFLASGGVISWASGDVVITHSTDQLELSGTNSKLVFTGGTVTTSRPLLDMTQTWNSGATTFTGIKLNITNTASAVASLFADFQIGGSSIIKIGPMNSVTSAPAILMDVGSGSFHGMYVASGLLGFGGATQVNAVITDNDIRTAAANRIGWSSVASAVNGSDTAFIRSDVAVIGITDASTGGGSLEFTEISAPASPAANKIRFYSKDVAGTTALFTKDSTGTEVQLGSGGGGSAGGSDTQVQFNDGGSAFGGDAGLVYNKTTDILTIAGGLRISAGISAPTSSDGAALGSTSLMWSDLFLASGAVVNFAAGDIALTHSTDNLTLSGTDMQFTLAGGTVTASKPPLVITQTWNNGITKFTAFSISITRSAASGGGPKFFDFANTNGDARIIGLANEQQPALGVGNSNSTNFAYLYNSGGPVLATGDADSPGTILFFASSSSALTDNPRSAQVGADGVFAWSAVASATNSADTALFRDGAAGVIAVRNGTNANAFRWYNTRTDASNYVRGALQTGSDYIEIAAETAGTGADNLDVRVTPAGTGNVRFGTHTSLASETVTGYITIKDAGGTLRKVAVVS